VKDVLHIKFISEISLTYKVHIYDIAGRLIMDSSIIKAESTGDAEVNLSSLLPGTYMISFSDNEGIQLGTSGFIKQ
jgi:hypothetical protein